MLTCRGGVLVAAALLLAAGCAGDGVEVTEEPADEEATGPEAVAEDADGDPFDDDPFADEDPFADDDPFAGEHGDTDDPLGPLVVPAALEAFPDLPPGARLDHVEVYDGPEGPEYSIDASYHDAGADELGLAADHYRGALPAAGWQIVHEYVDDEVAELFVEGHGLEGSLFIDIEMGSVWINAYLTPVR